MQGPVLLILYINDLPDVVNSFIYLFEEDTQLRRKFESSTNSDILQNVLNLLANWYSYDHEICVILCTLSDHLFQFTSTKKDLGVTFDSKTAFEPHITENVNTSTLNYWTNRKSFYSH